MLAPINIARGMGMAGEPLNFGDQWVLVFKRVGDKVHLIRRNVHYKAPAGSAVERAVQQNYLDSVLLALPIVSINHANSNAVVIDLADIFLTDFAQLQLFGSLDRNRTTWHKIKGYPNNLEIEVEATYTGGPYYYYFFDEAAADRRGKTLIIHYSLVKTPDDGYKPRFADDRVGHFLDAAKDFGKADPDTYFVRQINRWRLEKVDPKAKLSPPKKQIIWYIEATVPEKYPPGRRGGHPRVEQGVREDRLQERHRRPLADGRPRRVRPRGHQLLHLPLGHRRRGRRLLGAAVQPPDRRDDRRRRRLRRRPGPLLEAGVRLHDRHCADRSR